jgi:hypothetical protein
MKRFTCIFGIVLCLQLLSVAQIRPEKISEYIEKIVEQKVVSSDDAVDIESIISDLETLYINPINLNTATQDELDKLWILTDFQILALLDHRRKMGEIVSMNELSYVYGFTPEMVNLITPFTVVGSKDAKREVSIQQAASQLNHEIIIRAGQTMKKKEGVNTQNQKYYTRYKAWYRNRISMGLLSEKDAGEDFFQKSNKTGFDFYSGFIQYRGNGLLQQVTLGDYRMRAGQGLLIWPGFSAGKSSQVTSVQKRGQGITGNTSADEYNFFRGGAFKLGYGNISLSVFGSFKQIDATTDSSGSRITTIRQTGLHRTLTEKRYEQNTTEHLFGSTVNFRTPHIRFGLNYLNTSYSMPVTANEELYKSNYFKGSEFSGYSADYKLLFPKLQVYGEIAHANKSTAIVSGINFMPQSQLLATMMYRFYPESYCAPYSNALAEGSKTSNEEGLFTGIQWTTNWKTKLSAYADIFFFPWVKYQIDAPSKGVDYQLEGVFYLSENLELTLRYKNQDKERNYSPAEGTVMANLHMFNNKSLRTHLWYKLSDNLTMATRYEWSQSGYLNEQKQPGYLLYQDLVYTIKDILQVNFRYAWFDVEDYDSRIYAYEHNVRYAYSLPAYYGKGTKSYFVLRYNSIGWMTVWLRYGYTSYFNDPSSNKHDMWLQFIIRL